MAVAVLSFNATPSSWRGGFSWRGVAAPYAWRRGGHGGTMAEIKCFWAFFGLFIWVIFFGLRCFFLTLRCAAPDFFLTLLPYFVFVLTHRCALLLPLRATSSTSGLRPHTPLRVTSASSNAGDSFNAGDSSNAGDFFGSSNFPRPATSATNRLITSKDHASVQINIGHLDETGRYTGQFSTFALCGFIRAQGDADSALDRLWQKKKVETRQQ